MDIFMKHYQSKADAEEKADEMSDEDRLKAFVTSVRKFTTYEDEHVDALTSWMSSVTSGGSASNAAPHPLPLPIPDKQTRTDVHKLVRLYLSPVTSKTATSAADPPVQTIDLHPPTRNAMKSPYGPGAAGSGGGGGGGRNNKKRKVRRTCRMLYFV